MLKLSSDETAELSQRLLRAEDLPGPARMAFFLDLDGTLIDIAPRPDAVRRPPGLRSTLIRLRALCDGALAVVTGRRRSFAAGLLDVPGLSVIGLHGAEWPQSALPRLPEKTTNTLRRFAAARPGLVFEDKGASLALHYRLAPELQPSAEAAMAEALEEAGAGYHLRFGHHVLELCPDSADKGRAVARLMETPPFAGRLAFAAGDDLTDEAMFAEVNRGGGVSLRLGQDIRPTAARFCCPDPVSFRDFLERLAA